jgi:hypothetical protein
MSISNHSVDVKASSADLAKQLEGYEASLEALNEGDLLSEANADTAEWLESGIELIEAELGRREDEDNEDGQHYDSPDIYDTMGDRPSYAN